MQQLALDVGLPSGPTLDNFLVGANGALIAHLCTWLAGEPCSPVPLYLWGGSGVGKTHLLRAVQTRLTGQGVPVGWLDAQDVSPMPYDEHWAVVVLDDAHLYTAAQQQAAFSYFVQAQTHQVPVLAAGDAAPASLLLREDLRTRLGWGHVFEVVPLPGADRREVLRRELHRRGLGAADEVIDFMLLRFSRDLGSLMQLLDALDRYALQTQRAVTIPLLKAMLETL